MARQYLLIAADGKDEQLVTFEACSAGGYRTVVGEQVVQAEALPLADGSVLLCDSEGWVHDVLVHVDPRKPVVTVVGARGELRLELLGERELARRDRRQRSAIHGGGAVPIESPMPGRIVKILVDLGDEVSAGQPVIVVSAMKMDNELRAPAAGSVTRVAVEQGDSVEAGQTLLIIE